MQFQIPSAAVLLLLGSSSLASAACIGPDVNQATLDLVKEFEGWYPDICTWLSLGSSDGTYQANSRARRRPCWPAYRRVRTSLLRLQLL